MLTMVVGQKRTALYIRPPQPRATPQAQAPILWRPNLGKTELDRILDSWVVQAGPPKVFELEPGFANAFLDDMITNEQ